MGGVLGAGVRACVGFGQGLSSGVHAFESVQIGVRGCVSFANEAAATFEHKANRLFVIECEENVI